jgi:hypothetical protein
MTNQVKLRNFNRHLKTIEFETTDSHFSDLSDLLKTIAEYIDQHPELNIFVIKIEFYGDDYRESWFGTIYDLKPDDPTARQ